VGRGRRVIGETVQVPLDAALVGALPPVCVMTGAPAAGYAPMIVPKSLGIAWLLLALGPLGWVLLAALYPRLRVRYEIRVPMSERAFDRWMTERRRRLWGSWLGGALVIVGVGIRALGPLALLVALAGLLLVGVGLRAHWRIPWLQPSLSADARGRRVTMRGVHERFVVAVSRTLRRGAR
jgi:hypothetical protein